MIRHCAETAPKRWFEETDNMRTWATPDFKSFAYQTLAVTFWKADLAKARRHHAAHAAPNDGGAHGAPIK
jgi:hypothetical protein